MKDFLRDKYTRNIDIAILCLILSAVCLIASAVMSVVSATL